MNDGIVTVFIVFMVAISGCRALQCYVCSSLVDDKCGVTWGYSKDGGEGDKYLVDCPGENAACRKIQTKDSHGGQMVVSRSCWNSTSTERYKPPTKCGDIFMGEVCYCWGEEPCNGAQLIQPLKLAALLVLSPILWLFL